MQGIVSILKQFNEALPIKIHFNYIMLGLSSPEGETKKSYNGMNEMFLIKMFQLYLLEPSEMTFGRSRFTYNIEGDIHSF